jgi:hypothetical protein
MALGDVITTLRDARGHYVRAGASLTGADCSGLVSVAQSLATGLPIHRFGSTRTILAGAWPHAIPGAVEGDAFIIGANSRHMVARVDGVGIEATTSGQPFKIGSEARSPFAPEFNQWHLDPAVLMMF